MRKNIRFIFPPGQVNLFNLFLKCASGLQGQNYHEKLSYTNGIKCNS